MSAYTSGLPLVRHGAPSMLTPTRKSMVGVPAATSYCGASNNMSGDPESTTATFLWLVRFILGAELQLRWRQSMPRKLLMLEWRKLYVECESCRCLATFNGNLLLKKNQGDMVRDVRRAADDAAVLPRSKPIRRDRAWCCTDLCSSDKRPTRASSSRQERMRHDRHHRWTRSRRATRTLQQLRIAGATRGPEKDRRMAKSESRRSRGPPGPLRIYSIT